MALQGLSKSSPKAQNVQRRGCPGAPPPSLPCLRPHVQWRDPARGTPGPSRVSPNRHSVLAPRLPRRLPLPLPVSDHTCDGESLLIALQGLPSLTQGQSVHCRGCPAASPSPFCLRSHVRWREPAHGTPGPSESTQGHSVHCRGCPAAPPPPPVSDLTCDGESLLMALQGLPSLTQGHDVQCRGCPAASPPPSCLRSHVRWREPAHSTPGPSESHPRHECAVPRLPRCMPPPPPVSDLTCDGESLLMALQGLPSLTQIIVCKAEVAQCAAFCLAIAQHAGSSELTLANGNRLARAHETASH